MTTIAQIKTTGANEMTTERAGFITRFVHQLAGGRWVVAQRDDRSNQWNAPMTALESRLTGCSFYFARTVEGLGCTSYANKASAVRRAVKAYGDSED